ncbi:MAG: CRISPR-associated protein Cas4 [Candidatus Anstonellaceae archaeon]
MYIDNEDIITGTQINYLYICVTKLWFFCHQITMEHESDIVISGKIINELSYPREKKNIIENKIAIDFIKKGDRLEIHEIKKSKKMEKANEMQLLYYLYTLKKKGIKNVIGVLDYPLIRKRKIIELSEEKEKEILEAMLEIKKIKSMRFPPKQIYRKYCRKCSYWQLCWTE